MLIQNGADMTVPDDDGQSVLKMSLKSINTGVYTLWFGVRELAHKTMHIVSHPMDILRKSNVEVSYDPSKEMFEGKNLPQSNSVNQVIKTNIGIDDVYKIIETFQNIIRMMY